MSPQWALTSHNGSWVSLLFQGTHSKGGTVHDSLGSPIVGAYMFVCVTVIQSQAIIHGLNQRYLSVDGRGLALQTLRGKFKSLSTKANVCKPQGQKTGFQKEREKNTKEKSFPWGEKISKEKSKNSVFNLR